MEDFETVVFEIDDLERQDMCKVTELLALLNHQDSKSNVEKHISQFLITKSLPGLKIYRFTP